MKVLHLWVTLLAVSSSLFSQEAISLDSYISENKKDIFSYDYKKNEEEGLILRDSWISPIILNYSYSKSNPFEQVQTNQAAAIKMDQAIFRGGEIGRAHV